MPNVISPPARNKIKKRNMKKDRNDIVMTSSFNLFPLNFNAIRWTKFQHKFHYNSSNRYQNIGLKSGTDKHIDKSAYIHADTHIYEETKIKFGAPSTLEGHGGWGGEDRFTQKYRVKSWNDLCFDFALM